MKLLLLGSYAPSLLTFRGPLIKDVLSLGHQVAVGAPDIQEPVRRELEAMGAEVFETPLQRTGQNPISDIKYGIHLHKLIKTCRPDRVLTYTIKPNIWGALASSLSGTRSFAMITGLGIMFTETGVPISLRTQILRRVAKKLCALGTARNHRVIFQNPDDLNDFLEERCLADRSKAALINGSGVDLLHYSEQPLPPNASFLMVARLLRSKGVREYAEASLALKLQFPETRFRLVGYFDEGLDSISASDLDRWRKGGLEYSGPLSDIRQAMADASIFVLPSYREGTPRSVLEAMAMGRAIITTDAPGCRETVRQSENGFLVPVRNVSELERAMKRFIAGPELISKMGRASSLMAREKYDVDAVNRDIMSLLEL